MRVLVLDLCILLLRRCVVEVGFCRRFFGGMEGGVVRSLVGLFILGFEERLFRKY